MKKNNFNKFLLARRRCLKSKGIVLALVILNRPFWLVSSVGRALHRYHRGHGFKLRTGLNFFRPRFYCCLSSVHYCKDHSHIHFLYAVHMYYFSHIHIHSDQGQFSCLKILYIPNLP